MKKVACSTILLGIMGLSGCNSGVNNPCAGKNIGDTVKGGLIFQLPDDSNNNTCKVIAVASTDTNKPWGCEGTPIPGAISTTDGVANTDAIVATDCGKLDTAAKYCSDLTSNGFSNWYLPAKDELSKVFAKKAALNAAGAVLGDDYYWSSTEIDSGNALGYYFGDGGRYVSSKSDDYGRVRCVRGF